MITVLFWVLVAGHIAWAALGVIDELDDLTPEDIARLACFLHLMSGDTHGH